MTNEIQLKLKEFIDFSCLNDFQSINYAQHGFIPLGKKENVFYIAMLDTNDQNKVQQYIAPILKSNQYKILLINKESFDDLNNHINTHLVNTATKLPEKSDNTIKGTKRKIGEILIEMGFITEEQLFDSLVEAKKTSLPVGAILVQKGYISINELKTALSEQQGFEPVNSEQLKIDENILSILPEDFIKLNQVIPLSFDGKTLVVGMVNPNEKHIINDIVYLTGLRPRIMLITY